MSRSNFPFKNPSQILLNCFEKFFHPTAEASNKDKHGET